MKKKKSWQGFLGAFVVTIVISFLVYECNYERNNKREQLEGIWLVDVQPEPVILTLSTSYGYKSGQFSHVRVVDPENGKILHSQRFSRNSWSGDDMKLMTATSIWINGGNDWHCLDFPSLKKRWTQKSFFAFLRKTHPEMGDPYSMKLIGSQFEITNTSGKTFWIGVRDVETNSPDPTYCFMFSEGNVIGRNVYYTTPETRFTQNEGISIEIEDVDGNRKKTYHWETMNIHQKLMADTGYAQRYAVFAPDSGCYFFDGNHSRIAYQLADDSLELKWTPMFNKREWLEGDFLRPYKQYSYMADHRLITTKDNIAFVHYWTSLDKNENKLKLAGVDLKNQQILWDIDLTDKGIIDGCKPTQSEIFKNTLLIVWINNAHQGIVTAIDPISGNIQWSLKK